MPLGLRELSDGDLSARSAQMTESGRTDSLDDAAQRERHATMDVVAHRLLAALVICMVATTALAPTGTAATGTAATSTAATATTVLAPPTTTPTPIKNGIPPPVVTIPFRTKAQSAHVNPLFAYLSGVGFLVALLMMGTQYVLTRPGRRGRTL